MQMHILLIRKRLKLNFRSVNFLAFTKRNASHGYQLCNCPVSHHFFPALLTSKSFFKHWLHGHVSCTVAYPSWNRMVDLPNSHGIPRINNKHNQKSHRKKREKEKKKEMWLSIWTVFFFCPHVSLTMSRQHNTEVHLISPGRFPTPCWS